MSSFYVDHETWAFAIRKWLCSAKFYLIRSLMQALGYTSLAKKVWAGWQVSTSLSSVASPSESALAADATRGHAAPS